jgi:WD40 repeat protein
MGSIQLRHPGLERFVLLDGGTTALTAGTDRTLRTWDVATGKLQRSIRLQSNPGWPIAISPDGRPWSDTMGRSLSSGRRQLQANELLRSLKSQGYKSADVIDRDGLTACRLEIGSSSLPFRMPISTWSTYSHPVSNRQRGL